MPADLLLGIGGLLLYALLPRRWKSIFWVNLVILLPVAAMVLWSQFHSGYTGRQLGIRTDRWFAGVGAVALLTAAAATLMAVLAATNHRLRWNRNMTTAFLLYPLWGIAQQFLILSFFTVRFVGLGLPPSVVAVLTGLAFMALHVPNDPTMLATLGLGICFSLLFQAEPNILTLGIAHGWLGALYYYWVLGHDVLAEKFGKP